jgi:Thioesterase superfamily
VQSCRSSVRRASNLIVARAAAPRIGTNPQVRLWSSTTLPLRLGLGDRAQRRVEVGFLGRQRQGGEVTATARPLHVGRSVIVVQTELVDATASAVAQVTQAQAVLGREHVA